MDVPPGAQWTAAAVELCKCESLLRQRPFLQFPPLIPQHGGGQLSRSGRRVMPGCRNGYQAVTPRVGIEAEEPSLPPDEPLPVVRQGDPGLHQPEMDLVGTAHPDAALERVLQFGQKVRPGSL